MDPVNEGTATEETTPAEQPVEDTSTQAPAAKRPVRRRTTKVSPGGTEPDGDNAGGEELAGAEPAQKPVRRRATRKTAGEAVAAAAPAGGAETVADSSPSAAAPEGAASSEPAATSEPAAAPKTVRRRTTRAVKKQDAALEDNTGTPDTLPGGAPADATEAAVPDATVATDAVPIDATAVPDIAVAPSAAALDAAAPDTAVVPEAAAADPAAPAAKAPAKRRATRRAAAPAGDAAVTTAGDAGQATPAAEAEEATAAVTAAGLDAGQAAPAEESAAKPARTRSRRATKAQEAPAAEEQPAQTTETTVDTAQSAPSASGGAVADVAAGATEETAETPGESAGTPLADPFAVPDSPVSLLFHAPDLSVVVPVKAEDEDLEEAESEDERAAGRRSRRSRGRGRTEALAEAQEEEAAAGQEGPAEEGVVSRRRRRRRRGDADLELAGGQDDDPPNTVTRVRGPRQASEAPVSNKVTSVKGSTRLEAKRQRRRESRDSGRRRHVITEAEFLARRESVDRQMVVRQREDRIQIGVLEDGVLAEHFVSKTQQDSLIGNVYVGKVQNVLPSMEAAFVDIGRGRNAVLYAGEVNWDVAGLGGQPRRIEHALKSGDSVLVQVTKDPVGHKGARLTSQISLPGRYLVYVPGGSMTGISRKLPDVERNRLKKILKDHLPENAGVIVRTAAEGASEQELMNDINRLRAQWEEIERKSTSTKTLPPEMLYGEPDLTIKVVRDVFNEDFSKLVVSGEEAWDTIEAYVTYVAPDLLGRLEKWESDEDIFAANRIDEQIHKALDRKVFLPSGGSLVIDRTEAMTVVDVNTGKFTGSGGNLEETVTKNNLEAAEEIVRQLRLRDIGGIIVIDFIDMVLEANRDLVLRRLVECLGRDRTKHQVAEVTSLGLVQMTRKRMGTGLLEVFSENCEACSGRGVITHDEPLEHRRAHTSQGEPQQPARSGRTERNDRNDRRRRRGGAETAHEPAAEQAPAAPAPVDPEQKAKADAARAAFANIAAAAHAAHEHEAEAAGHDAGAHPAAQPAAGRDEQPAGARDQVGGRGQAEAAGQDEGGRQDDGGSGSRRSRRSRRDRGAAQAAGEAPAAQVQAPASSAVAQPVEDRPAEQEPGQVLNIGGAEVALPRGRRSRRASAPAQAPEMTLESLTAAFGGPAQEPAAEEPDVRTAAPAQGSGAAAPTPTQPVRESAPAADAGTLGPAAPEAPAAPETVAAPEAPVAPPAPARKVRRQRAARSAQGGADSAIERVDSAAGSPEPAAAAHVAKLSVSRPSPVKPGTAEPMILGVGVPASEL